MIDEYEVDPNTETLHAISTTASAGITGADMGDAYRLPNGNILHNHGSNPRLQEVTPNGELAWDLEWPTDTIGRSTGLSDLYVLAPIPE